jgi:hypothetical protein
MCCSHKERKENLHDNCSGVVAFNHLDDSALVVLPVMCCREGRDLRSEMGGLGLGRSGGGSRGYWYLGCS